MSSAWRPRGSLASLRRSRCGARCGRRTIGSGRASSGRTLKRQSFLCTSTLAFKSSSRVRSSPGSAPLQTSISPRPSTGVSSSSARSRATTWSKSKASRTQ
eukprot:Amastigsp_a174919_9.p5 type:complete len:101 gc:universal Amastigsp_a174919_9:115-417(+)